MKRNSYILAAAAALMIFGTQTAFGAVVEGINGGPGFSLGTEESGKGLTGSSGITGVRQLTALGTDITRLDIPADAEVVVIVEGSGLNASVSAYKRDLIAEAQVSEGGDTVPAEYTQWLYVTSTELGKLGRKGLGKTREGDEKTPLGIFRMNTPFGIKDALEGFPDNYIKVSSDMYWNGDSQSELYNRLVSTDTYDAFSRSASEHLIDYGGYYDYCIDMGYNPQGTPYLGSALFLHCSMGINTGGCIAIPEENMIEIMKAYREGKTYIAVGDAANMDVLYRPE